MTDEVPMILWTPHRHKQPKEVSNEWPRRNFTAEFKQEAVALVWRSGQSANQVPKELDVSRTALSRRLREATRHTSGPNGFGSAEELKVLRRDVERLRMETPSIICPRG
jgi:transposase